MYEYVIHSQTEVFKIKTVKEKSKSLILLIKISHSNMKHFIHIHIYCVSVLLWFLLAWWPLQQHLLTVTLGIGCRFVLFIATLTIFSRHQAVITTTCDRTTNLSLCLPLTVFSNEGSFFTCHTCCNMGPSFLRSYLKDPRFSLYRRSNQYLLQHHKFDAAGLSRDRTRSWPPDHELYHIRLSWQWFSRDENFQWTI
jgi:hypothetical protein